MYNVALTVAVLKWFPKFRVTKNCSDTGYSYVRWSFGAPPPTTRRKKRDMFYILDVKNVCTVNQNGCLPGAEPPIKIRSFVGFQNASLPPEICSFCECNQQTRVSWKPPQRELFSSPKNTRIHKTTNHTIDCEV